MLGDGHGLELMAYTHIFINNPTSEEKFEFIRLRFVFLQVERLLPMFLVLHR
jgi:hypothetical protein